MESDPTDVIKEDNPEKNKKKSSRNSLSKLFTVIKENTTWQTDTEIISDKHENVEKVTIYSNSNDSNNFGFEALNSHDEK